MPRFWRFNGVGVLGFGVQVLTLAVLDGAGVPGDAAVAVAVLAAIVHNFAWHERYTWPGRPRAGRLRRFAAFVTTSGLISIAVNVGITTRLASATGLPLVAANLAAVLAASLVNFWIGDRGIYRDGRGAARAARGASAADEPRRLVRSIT